MLNVSGNGIAEAWENSVVELYHKGIKYKRSGPKDKGQDQIDSSMLIEIKDADKYPFFHRFSNCGWEDLLEYGFEILGAKNPLVVNEYDPENDERWPYHYNDRMVRYPSKSGAIDQIENIVNKLIKKPHTRGASISIWVPDQDVESRDPPCLQHLWFALTPGEKDNEFDLNMNYMFRSRNVMIAAPMNMFGLHILQNYVKDSINKKSAFKVNNGRIVDYSNAYHVSSRDLEKLTNFMNRYTKKKDEGIESRVYTREDTFDMMKDCFTRIEDKVKDMVKSRLEERKLLNPNSKTLDKLLKESLNNIDNISTYLRGFIENVKTD